MRAGAPQLIAWDAPVLQLRTARDGYPECLGQPLTLLAADFPLRPKLMGGLLPQQINIWMGAAKNGAATHLSNVFPCLCQMSCGDVSCPRRNHQGS